MTASAPPYPRGWPATSGRVATHCLCDPRAVCPHPTGPPQTASCPIWRRAGFTHGIAAAHRLTQTTTCGLIPPPPLLLPLQFQV